MVNKDVYIGEITTGSTPVGAHRWGIKILRLSTIVSLYLANDTR